ncbi:MAG: AAA family ATPase [Armatimonadota bacterium]
MIDQAATLRTMVRQRGSGSMDYGYCLGSLPPYTIAITSGKGGVGKTSLAVNLSLLLVQDGRQVWLVDADFGLANADVLLGVLPAFSIREVLHGEVRLSEAWVDVIPGLKLLPAGSGFEDVADLDSDQVTFLVRQVKELAGNNDVVVLDTAPGIHESVVSVLPLADEVIVVTTPEPTALTDAYATMKIMFARCSESDVTLVINCCESAAQAASLAESMDSICRKFLNRSFRRYEYLPSDRSMAMAVKIQKPVITSARRSAIEPWLRKMAIRLNERMSARRMRSSVINHDSEIACRDGFNNIICSAPGVSIG